MHTADPIRDRGWWLRSALYLLVFASAQWLPGAPTAVLIGLTVFSLAAACLGIWWRDRRPWLLATIGLLFGATFAEAPVAAGMVVVASRARPRSTVCYALAAVAVLTLPWPRLLGAGLSITYTGQPWESLLYWVFRMLILVVVPALVGTLRRVSWQATQQRLRFEANQRELAAEQAVAAERNRIAQEMHDVLGHKLTLLTLQAGALEVSTTSENARVSGQAELIRQTSKQALDDLRGIIGVLGESDADARRPQPGLADTLELIAHNRASGSRIEVANELPAGSVLPAPVGAALHRIVTEGLTNAHKHSPGAAIRLRLAGAPGAELIIELINRPTARSDIGAGAGRGLPGLAERVRTLGGRFEAGSTADGGYRLAVSLPWPMAGDALSPAGLRAEGGREIS